MPDMTKEKRRKRQKKKKVKKVGGRVVLGRGREREEGERKRCQDLIILCYSLFFKCYPLGDGYSG